MRFEVDRGGVRVGLGLEDQYAFHHLAVVRVCDHDLELVARGKHSLELALDSHAPLVSEALVIKRGGNGCRDLDLDDCAEGMPRADLTS